MRIKKFLKSIFILAILGLGSCQNVPPSISNSATSDTSYIEPSNSATSETISTGTSEITYENRLIIAQKAYKTIFNVNEQFSNEGLVLVDKTGHRVDDYVCSISNGTLLRREGERIVELTKENYEPTSYTIEVKKLPSLVVSSLPIKTVYQKGEKFSSNGLIVADDHNNIISEYTLSLEEGFKFTTSGEIEITVSKTNYISASFTIFVEREEGLEITHLPNKLEYQVCDPFSSQGLSVVNGKDGKPVEYSLSIEDGELLKCIGTIDVYIKSEGLEEISFPISVTKADNILSIPNDEVNIYYVNDTHGSFIRNPNLEKPSLSEAGMAYIGQYIMDKKETDKNTIVLSGGDMFQGGCESNDTRGKIMIDAMNIIGFDAMALGNHEFDWGESIIKRNSELMDFDLISCNTFYSFDQKTRPDWVKPFSIIKRDNLKIGVVGYARYNMGSSVDGQYGDDFSFPTPLGYIQTYSSMLRTSYNCDLVVSVGHDEGYEGYGSEGPVNLKSLTEVNQETGFRYVDAMFFAHDHLYKLGKLNNVTYLESGSNGVNVGHVKFDLSWGANKFNITSEGDVKNAYSYCQTENPAISALTLKYQDEFLVDPDLVLQTFTNPYSKVEFARLICQAMVWFVNSNKDLFDDAYVYIGSHNSGGVRVDTIPAGPFTYRDLVKAYPFDNELCIEKCNSSNVSAILRSSNPYYQLATPKYQNGYTQCVTISYIANSSYSRGQYTSYVQYESTSKVALVRFLNSGEVI